MCEAPTLTAAKRIEPQKRIADGAAAIASDKTFTAKTAAAALNTTAAKCCAKVLPASDRVPLRPLLQGSETELDAFLAIYDALDLPCRLVLTRMYLRKLAIPAHPTADGQNSSPLHPSAIGVRWPPPRFAPEPPSDIRQPPWSAR
jgi:hypothetical protein